MRSGLDTPSPKPSLSEPPQLYNLSRLAKALGFDRSYVGRMIQALLEASRYTSRPLPSYLMPAACLLYEKDGRPQRVLLFTAEQIARAAEVRAEREAQGVDSTGLICQEERHVSV